MESSVTPGPDLASSLRKPMMQCRFLPLPLAAANLLAIWSTACADFCTPCPSSPVCCTKVLDAAAAAAAVADNDADADDEVVVVAAAEEEPDWAAAPRLSTSSPPAASVGSCPPLGEGEGSEGEGAAVLLASAALASEADSFFLDARVWTPSSGWRALK